MATNPAPLPQDADELKNPAESAPEQDPLPEDLQQELLKLLYKCTLEDIYPRLIEVKDVKRAHLYWRGQQYTWWSDKKQDYLPAGATESGGETSMDDMPRFMFETNIFQGFGLSLTAALSQAPPRIRWFPEDADKPEDLEAAEKYTTIAKCIERWNPTNKLLQDQSFYFYCDGVMGSYSRYVADGEQYGTEEIEDYESEEQPIDPAQPGTTAPFPVSAGTEEIAKGREVITVVGALNLQRPQWAKEQGEFHYLNYVKEVHYAKLRAAFPKIADKIKPGSSTGNGEDAFERNARLSVAQGTRILTQTGAAQESLVTFNRVWFRPSAFFMVEDVAKRKELLRRFKTGCAAVFAGETYCESREESMDDCWVVTHAMPGDGQHRPGIGTSMISVQDRYNTFSNIQAETYEYGIPTTYFDQQFLSSEAFKERRSEPGENTPVPLKPEDNINNKILLARADSASPDMIQHMQELFGNIPQFLTGSFPAMWGGAEPGTDTASGLAQQRDQAMGRVGIFYSNMKQFHADTYSLACKDFCEHASGKVSVPVLGKSGDFESESVDITALEGTAEAHPEGDENFPALWSQQRAVFMQVMDHPLGQQIMQEPDNQEVAQKLLGIPELVIPGAAARKKAMKIIGKLTEIPPHQESAEIGLAQPPQDQSADLSMMIPQLVDPDFGDPAAQFETVKNWINSRDGQKCEEENPTGFANVRAYGLAQKQLIPKQQPPTKPLSETFTTAFKDLPPEAQAQALEQMGIHVDANAFIEKAMLDKLSKPAPKPISSPSGNGNPAGQPAKPGTEVAQ
jgi:hypothetical protein